MAMFCDAGTDNFFTAQLKTRASLRNIGSSAGKSGRGREARGARRRRKLGELGALRDCF